MQQAAYYATTPLDRDTSGNRILSLYRKELLSPNTALEWSIADHSF